MGQPGRRWTTIEQRVRARRPKATSVALLVALLVGVVALVVGSRPTDAGPTCTKTWAEPAGGDWTDPDRWEPAGVPTATDDVCITADGAYAVYAKGTLAAASLQLGTGPSGAGPVELIVEGNSCGTDAELTITSSAEIFDDGELVLLSGDCGAAAASLRTGGLTNHGVLRSGYGNGGPRSIVGPVTNHGTLEVSEPLAYGEPGDVFDNQGTVELYTTMEVGPLATFVHTSGTLTVPEVNWFRVVDGTFEQGAGATDGSPLVIEGGRLRALGTGATSSGFDLRGNSTLEGGLAANQQVQVTGDGCGNPATTTLDGAFTNAGTIVLTSVGCFGAGAALEGSELLTNTGTLAIELGDGGDRDLRLPLRNEGTVDVGATTRHQIGPLTNAGTISVTAGELLVEATVDNEAGTIDSTGTGVVRLSPGNRFVQGDGSTTGTPVVLEGGTIEFTPGGTGTGHVVAQGVSDLVGDVPAGTTVEVEAPGCSDPATLGWSADTTNAGTIVLTSSGCGPALAELVSPYLLTNTGTIEVAGGGPEGRRAIKANVVNQGVLDVHWPLVIGRLDDPFYAPTIFTNEGTVNAGADISVIEATFNHLDGLIDGTGGRLRIVDGASFFQLFGQTSGAPVEVLGGSTLEFSSVSTGSVEVLVGDGVSLVGDVPAGATVTVEGVGCSSPAAASLTAAGPATNHGTLVLSSSGCLGGGSATLAAGGTFTNAGTVRSANGQLGDRTIDAPSFVNQGTLRVEHRAPITLTGNVTLDGAGTMITDIGMLGTGYLQVAGTLTFGGTLRPLPSFTPTYGSSFQVATYAAPSGRFDTVDVGSVDFRELYGIDQFLLQVLKPSEITLVTDPVGSTVAGAPVELRATVAVLAPNDGVPVGTAYFYDGATYLGYAGVDGSGSASLVRSDLTVGAHSLRAEYSGDATIAPSESAPVALQIDPAATVTTLASTPNPAVAFGGVTFTATVAVEAPATGVPTGEVTFTNGPFTLGTAPVEPSGEATLTTFSLPVGTSPVRASYLGDGSRSPSSSAVLLQQVDSVATTTVLTSAPQPSVSGQAVTLRASLSTPSGTIIGAGNVTFSDGGTVLGAAPILSGEAELVVDALTVGVHPLRATYSGVAGIAGSASDVIDHVVDPGTTSIELSSSANPSVPGQPVDLTAQVSVVAPAVGAPTGTVEFTSGATVLGAVAVDGAGTAVLTTADLPEGTQAIVAAYLGDASFAPATSAAIDQVVAALPVPTVTTLEVDPGTLVATQPVQLRAAVATDPPGSTVAGEVVFRDGATVLGAVELDVSGVATLDLPRGLRSGTRLLTAGFTGDPPLVSSTSAQTPVTVTKAQGSFTTTATIDPSRPGAVIFLVVATAAPPASMAPGGPVELRSGDEVIGTGRLVDGRAEIVQCFTPVCAPLPPTTTTTTSTTTSSTTTSSTTTSSTTTSSTTTTVTTPSTTTTTSRPDTTTVSRSGTSSPAVPATAMRALRAASTLEIIASYPGDDDFDAYRSDPIAVLVDGDTVALPSDPPPPPPPTTTTPSTPTSTPPSVPPGPPSEPPDAPATTTPAPGGDEQPEATEIVDDPDDLVAVAVAAATSSDPDDGADGADETAQAIDPDGSAPASGATTSIGGAADPDQGPRSSSAELGRSSLAASTADPTRISTDPRFVMENLLLTLFLLIFSVYPAYLINNTLAENYDEVLGWFGPVTRRTGRLRARRGAIPGPVVLGLSGLAAAVLYSFLDPGLGWNLTSLALFLGLFVSTVTITGVYDVARKRYLHHHYGIVSSLRGYPAGLLIGVVLVVFSRAADLTPGYLFGVFTALGFATQIDRRHDGRGIAAASVWLLAVTLACWFLWIPVADAASAPDAGFGTIFLDTTLASVWVVGIQALVFGLMPLRFLDGEKLRFWSTRAWVAIYGVGMFAFVHSMVRPGTEVDGDTFRSAVVLFALFTAVALAFWGYFRLRTDAPGDLEPPTDPPRADDLVDA